MLFDQILTQLFIKVVTSNIKDAKEYIPVETKFQTFLSW